MNKLFFIPAIIFLILGIIGLILPIIPQIPFFIVSIISFAAASEKFKRYIISTKIYKEYIEKYIKKHEKLSEIMNVDNNSK